MNAEVRPVGDDGFEEVYPLLRLFPSPRMTREDWRRMLFGYSWPGAGPTRGFALYVDGAPAGFYATIFSNRRLGGRLERYCNTACFVVAPQHRSRGLGSLLLDAIAEIPDCTVVHLTPSPITYAALEKRGRRPLEREVVILPPPLAPGALLRGLRGSWTSAPEELERDLEGDERCLFDDLRAEPVARHVLLRRGSRACYLVATPGRRKGLRTAALRYVGDPDFFWEHRALAHAALARTLGTVFVEIDGRLAADRRPAIAARRPARRCFAPARPDITPDRIDGLYSEWMGLKE